MAALAWGMVQHTRACTWGWVASAGGGGGRIVRACSGVMGGDVEVGACRWVYLYYSGECMGVWWCRRGHSRRGGGRWMGAASAGTIHLTLCQCTFMRLALSGTSQAPAHQRHAQT